MSVFLRILVIIFEVMYYSLFMKFARKEGSYWKYFLLYTLISIVLFFITSFNIYAYLVFILLSTIGLKTFSKTSLYDMFISFVMILFKLIIELICAIVLTQLTSNITLCKIILGVVKISTIFILSKQLGNGYEKFKKCWDSNNFYIRYLFSTLMFVYIISACLFLFNFG